MSKICAELHRIFNSKKRFYFPFNELEIPLDGIYILFEKGEYAHGKDRIVRVGTHTGMAQLRSRLKLQRNTLKLKTKTEFQLT